MFGKWVTTAAVLGLAAWAVADEVELVSGEVLKGVHVECAEGRVRFDHPILGRLDLAEDQVRAVRPDAGTDAEAGAAAGASSIPGSAGAAAAPAAPAEPAWKFKAELGLNGTSGNTKTQDLRAAIGALLEQPEHRWKFDAGWLRSKTDGVKTKDQAYVQGLKDWMWSDSPWIAFVTSRYDRDEFQAWDERVSVGAGVGYKLVDATDFKLRLRAGLNEVREYGSGNDFWRTEGLLGAEAVWKISDSQSLEGAVTWYPDLRDSGKYRLVSSIVWSIKLSSADNLSLKMGAEDEYDTHREPPFKKSDLKYFAAIQYEF